MFFLHEGRIGLFSNSLRHSRTACLAPAIKVTTQTSSTATFPLTRSELGTVWRNESEMLLWVEQRKEDDWRRARRLFADLVDYPSPFLSVLLQVFRSGRFTTAPSSLVIPGTEQCWTMLPSCPRALHVLGVGRPTSYPSLPCIRPKGAAQRLSVFSVQRALFRPVVTLE